MRAGVAVDAPPRIVLVKQALLDGHLDRPAEGMTPFSWLLVRRGKDGNSQAAAVSRKNADEDGDAGEDRGV